MIVDKSADTCVFTVVYPGMEAWLPDFADSLRQQDADAFDLVLVNDGLHPEALTDLQNACTCTVLDPAGGIAENRLAGFRYLLKSGYSNTVFADADDRMASNRVRTCVQLLRDYDIVANDLDIMEADGEIIRTAHWSDRLPDMSAITRDHILDANMIGLGNSSVRTSILANIIIPAEIEVVDWYLYALLLEKGHRAVFTTRTTTLYRQHDANILGAAAGKMDESTLGKWVRIKAAHYNALKHVSHAYSQKHAFYSELADKMEEPGVLAGHIASRSGYALNNPFWFEMV